jgi:glutathionyl-hydroquinone reductase
MPAPLRSWKELSVPFFFQRKTAEAFGAMAVQEEDVFMSSLPKGGTTWCHRILYLLLHGVNDEGEILPSEGVGSNAQIYPEALLTKRGAELDPDANDELRRKFFGEWTFEEDLCGQAAPRLFSTHLCGNALPAELLDPVAGRGRLVLVMRNLKDTLASLHFFRGEPKDGWHGNEHGPGSLARFLSEQCPNAYGSSFSWVKNADAIVSRLVASGRCIVMYYEDLSQALPAHLDRLAAFLGVPLTPAKREAIIKSVGFDAMKAGGGMANVLLRKGGIGDWRNHLSAADWARFDAVFDGSLGGVALAEPMRFHQMMEVDGLPPARGDHTLEDDPRAWPSFVRKTLVNGRVVRDTLIAASGGATFQRPPSEFNGTVEPPGTEGAKHVAEAGRYHLVVSGVCPWASSVRATRALLGLQDVVSIDVCDGQSGGGWVMIHGTTCPPWSERPGPFFAHELYQASDPLGTTRITVPILYDKKLQVIVSNDSWGIVKMLATAFPTLGSAAVGGTIQLYPPEQSAAIEELHSRIYAGLLNGVYRSGIALLKGNAEGASAAAGQVYETLDELEKRLATRRYLMGGAQPTAVDIRLTMTLLRYDSSYRCAFALRGGRGGVLVGDTEGGAPGYPNLCGYVRDMYAQIQPEVEWPSFRQYYRWAVGHPADAPLPSLTAIVASAGAPHGREALAVSG